MQKESIKKYAVYTAVSLLVTVAFVSAVNPSFAKTIDYDKNTVTYDIYFGTSSPPPKVVSNQSGTTYDPGTLSYNTTYYWKIVSWNDQGESAEGPIWHFTTEVLETNQPPVAVIVAPTVADKKTSVVFNGSESYDPDGTIVNYTWNFNDGNFDYGMIVNYSYQNSGAYDVILQVIDDDGATGVDNHTINIINHAPTASFVADHYIIEPGGTVIFNASASSDPDGDSLTYQWNFGDGTTGNGMVVSHIYLYSGNYAVYLTITDNDVNNPLSDTVATLIRVNAPPVAYFTYSPPNPYIGTVITFNASESYDPDGTIVNYTWNFGDGSFGYGMITQHVYYSNGLYNVTLTVMDNYGFTSSYSVNIYVAVPFSTGVVVVPVFRGYSVKDIKVSDACIETTIMLMEAPFQPHTPCKPFPEDGATNVSVDVVLSWTGGENNPPDTPIINGPTSGKPGITYYYNFTINDADGDALYLFIGWGDGTDNGWIGPLESGVYTASHTWAKKGTYTIGVKTKDVYGAESWGYLEVIMPRAKISAHMLLIRLLERFPNAFPILKHLLGLQGSNSARPI